MKRVRGIVICLLERTPCYLLSTKFYPQAWLYALLSVLGSRIPFSPGLRDWLRVLILPLRVVPIIVVGDNGHGLTLPKNHRLLRLKNFDLYVLQKLNLCTGTIVAYIRGKNHIGFLKKLQLFPVRINFMTKNLYNSRTVSVIAIFVVVTLGRRQRIAEIKTVTPKVV